MPFKIGNLLGCAVLLASGSVAYGQAGYVEISGVATFEFGETHEDRPFAFFAYPEYIMCDASQCTDFFYFRVAGLFEAFDNDVGVKTFSISGETALLPSILSFSLPMNVVVLVPGENRVFPGSEPVFGSVIETNLGLVVWSDVRNLNLRLDFSDMPPVPEPATWAMLIAGFGLVGATARRRRALAA